MPNTRYASVLLIGLAFSCPSNSYAEEKNTYVIAAGSGYGVEDCLGEGGECGRIVADAWCQAQGRGSAVKFGRSASPGDTAERPLFITCGN